MSARLSCPSAPGPLEAFSVQCDPLFQTWAQRHGFRTYLAGLLLPRDRSKTLTGGAGRRRAAGSGAGGRGAAAAVFSVRGRLRGEAVNTQRLALLGAEPATSASVCRRAGVR